MFWVKVLAACSVSILGIETSNYFTLNRNDIFGLNLLYFEHVLRPDDVHITYPVKSYCQCQHVCRVDPSCSIASVAKMGDGSLSCMVSKEAINDVSLMPSAKGVTFARKNTNYYLGEDGVFYKIITSSLTVPGGRAACETQFKHGKLMMPKNRIQFESAQDYRKHTNFLRDYDYMVFDLAWNSTLVDAVWGDGTRYSDTEIAKTEELNAWSTTAYFEVRSRNGVQYFQAVGEFKNSYVICEMNPLGSP